MKAQKKLTIIVADDDKDDRELLEFLFNQNKQFKLIGSFESGIEVLKEIMINKSIPDILLIDMYMPLLTGTEIIKKIEESGVASTMAKFIISTTISTTQQNKFHDNPSVKFIKKPISLAEVNDLPGIILEFFNVPNNSKI
jgi:FixJ family two-component response regulator